jgi:PAS domain S-box-containing protein
MSRSKGSKDRSSELDRKLEVVIQTGLLLTKSIDLESIVQSATDAGLELSGAQFGAFFYNIINSAGESKVLYTLSGIDREEFARFSTSGDMAAFAPAFDSKEIIRSADITKDFEFDNNAPFHGLLRGHPRIRSYLAVPVKNVTGEVLGGLYYAHEEVDVFEQSSEDLVATVAAQAAVAIENLRLRDQLTNRMGDLQRAQQAQREASKQLGELAAIVASSDDAILSKDLNGIITSWNQAATRVLGYSREEMIGASILKLIPEHLHGDEQVILGKIRTGERIDHFETVRRTKSGELLEVSLTISPVRDNTGTITGASKILRDISGRKRFEISLLQAEKIAAAGRMAATIAHEINNPLEAVVNLLYLLRSSVQNEEGIGYLQAAESELTRVSHIARQTLGFYREHAAATKSSLTEVAEQAIKIYEPRCSASGIRIESSLQSSTKIVLRRGEMMQVVSNLIANALYAMPSGGTLRISVRDSEPPQEGVIVVIADNGVGIPADNLSRVFEAFFTTRSAIGTGIGLFVAKQFIEGHGGTIEIKSHVEPENHGTIVSIFLPLHTTYENAPGVPHARGAETQPVRLDLVR